MCRYHLFPSTLLTLALLLGLAACDTTSSLDLTDVALTQDARPDHAQINRQLAAARAATAHFHAVAVAEAAGYAAASPCVYHGEEGGMGYHYVDFSLMGPPEALDVTRPQVLLYEPQEDGELRLVGIEYVVPFDQSATPPVLFGHAFHPGPLGWALHVWIWRNNPSGLFEDWNPRVSCEFADFAIDVTNPPPMP